MKYAMAVLPRKPSAEKTRPPLGIDPLARPPVEMMPPNAKEPDPVEKYYLPGDLEASIELFVEHKNHLMFHESLKNVTPAYVYLGRG